MGIKTLPYALVGRTFGQEGEWQKFSKRLNRRHAFSRRKSRRAVIAGLTALLVASAGMAPTASMADGMQSVTVTGAIEILDGNTIAIGPLHLRLHGIDALELGQSCATADGGAWPCGRVAAGRISPSSQASPPLDCAPLDRDPYGRVIARCVAGGEDVGERMVAEGLAWAYVEYSDNYVGIEADARMRRDGIWQAPTPTAKIYRDDVWGQAERDAPGAARSRGTSAERDRSTTRRGRRTTTLWRSRRTSERGGSAARQRREAGGVAAGEGAVTDWDEGYAPSFACLSARLNIRSISIRRASTSVRNAFRIYPSR